MKIQMLSLVSTPKAWKDVNNPEVATDTYFANRTILTTTYAVVHCINAAVANREIHKYVSGDATEDDMHGREYQRDPALQTDAEAK
ncbi:Helitron helicase-like protein [Phytophthora palmivora]|uniref:Helitron helicase-like protein n=1 Tax=Phytophthora palmivora TaxID=4796 RepID=A0A2P4X099_9STRA|nr:Helitron helicase-like protein [Phytophthora palmivora]